MKKAKLTIRPYSGDSLTPGVMKQFFRFYCNTCSKLARQYRGLGLTDAAVFTWILLACGGGAGRGWVPQQLPLNTFPALVPSILSAERFKQT